jgi:peroxiredoxin family protein
VSDAVRTGLDPVTKAYLDERLAAIERTLREERLREAPENRVTLVVFSGDLDRQLASLVIATGAAAMGMEVSVFYTFWGLTALKKQSILSGKTLKEKMFAAMTPASLSTMPLSKLNFGGMGRAMLTTMMKEKEVASIEELFAMARDMGVRQIACTMSMDVMGLTKEELLDGVVFGGVATFLGDAARSKVSLFI